MRGLGEGARAVHDRRTANLMTIRLADVRALEAKRPGSVEVHGAPMTKASPTSPSRARGGMRADLGIYLRSTAEANFSRYLNLLKAEGQIAGWAYEPKTFHFPGITRGTRDYTPDFRIDLPDGRHEWREVKGWLDPKSKTRLKRMKKYYPEETVVLIQQDWFANARRIGLAAMIPGWESGAKR